jgi:hypothetical protein
LISKNRKLIIQNNTCEIPNPEIRKKFNMWISTTATNTV